jgi:hypothetical protein
MSKRLQVLFDESDFGRLKDAARAEGMTLSEWVRQTLRRELRARPGASADRKLETVRAASRHHFPTADIDQMLAEIEQGYGGEAYPTTVATNDADDSAGGDAVHEPGT